MNFKELVPLESTMFYLLFSRTMVPGAVVSITKDYCRFGIYLLAAFPLFTAVCSGQSAPTCKLPPTPEVQIISGLAAQANSGKQGTNKDETRKEKYEYERHRSVVYAEYGESEKLLCDVYVPKGTGPFPAILMIHGGAWKSGTKLQMKGHAQAAAEKGFVAISINYRHAPRFKWPAQIDDCRKAFQWMLDQSETFKIDTNRLALWGYSAGGHLATYLATRKDKFFPKASIRCVVCGGGPVDLTQFPKDFRFLVYFLGATRRQAPERYRDASPITYLSAGDPPMFFYHGANDIVAPISGVKRMLAKAEEVGVPCELMMVPEKEHIMTFFDQASFDKGLQFIEKRMSNEEKE